MAPCAPFSPCRSRSHGRRPPGRFRRASRLAARCRRTTCTSRSPFSETSARRFSNDLDDILSATPLPAAPVAFRRARHLRRDGTRPRLRGGAADPRAFRASVEGGASGARMAGPSCRVDGSGPHVTLTRANRQPVGPARDRLAAALGAARVEIPAFDAAESCCFNRHLDPGRRAPRSACALSLSPIRPPEPAARSGRRAVAAPTAGAGHPATGRGVRTGSAPSCAARPEALRSIADGAPVRQGGKGSRRSAQSPAASRDTARPVRGET
jgi:hypothetical protein